MISAANWPRIGRLGGELMAAQGEFILFSSRNPVFRRQVLGGQPHVHDRLAVPSEQRGAGVVVLGHRHVFHVLDAAGNLNVLAAGGDAHGGVVDRLQARGAVAVDRHPTGLLGQPGDERGDSRDVEALLTLLLHAAPAHVFDLLAAAMPVRLRIACITWADRSSERTSRK